METMQVRFGERGFAPNAVVPLREGEKTLAQAVGRINREGKYAKVFSEDGITNHEDTDPYSGYDYHWSTWGAVCGLEILSESGVQVAVLREQMADISDLGYYSEHVASEAGRKVLSEVTERYAPYRKKNWGERRESKGLIFKQNPHVS